MAEITDISQLDLSKTYTYADYLAWRFTEYVELIKGRVMRRMSAPASAHQVVSTNLQGELYAFLKRQSCQIFAAPFDVRLTRSTGNGDGQVQTVVQPDICVVCDGSKIDEKGCVGAPDWIIEILSPSTALRDTRTKFDLYAENGVSEYWIVSPDERRVVTYQLEQSDYQLTGEYEAAGPIASVTLPTLRLEWEDVFRRVGPQ